MVEIYSDMVDCGFRLFQVKLWITFNEPFVTAWDGYGVGSHAPGIMSPATGSYEVTHNLILSHAEAWHTYDSEFRSTQNGERQNNC